MGANRMDGGARRGGVAVRCQMVTTGGNVNHVTVGDCRKGGCKKARLTSPTAFSSIDSHLFAFQLLLSTHAAYLALGGSPSRVAIQSSTPPLFFSRNDDAFPCSGRANLARGRTEPT